jgi:hypothetical protein
MYVKVVEINNPNNKEIYFPDTKMLPNVSGIDLNKLEPGKMFAFLKDKITIFGVYDSPRQAALFLDGKREYRYISRYINLERLVSVGPENIEVYFVMNPEYKKNTLRQGSKSPKYSKPIILVDTLKGTAIQYSSIKDFYIPRH